MTTETELRRHLLDVYGALGITWGQDPFAAIRQLEENFVHGQVEYIENLNRRRPDMYRIAQVFNNVVVGPEVDRTGMGVNVPPKKELSLARRLLREEVDEMDAALGYSWDEPSDAPVDHAEALDAACDIVYVLFGLMLRLGVTPDMFYAAFMEVTRANMAKAGGPTRADGKRLKPEGWTPPDIQGVIDAYNVQPGPEVAPDAETPARG